jgi:hypothetical protein
VKRKKKVRRQTRKAVECRGGSALRATAWRRKVREREMEKIPRREQANWP